MMVGVFGWLQHQFTWFRDVYDKTTDLPKMAFSSSLQDSFAVAILQNNCLRPLKYDPDFVYLLENLTCAHSPCDVLCKNNHRIFCQREEFQSILDKPSNFRKNNLNCYGTYIITQSKLLPCECTLTVSQIYSVFMPFLIFFSIPFTKLNTKNKIPIQILCFLKEKFIFKTSFLLFSR